MKLVLSPAKSLDFESKLPTHRTTQALFLTESERINKLLKKQSVKKLGQLMNISTDLSELNYQRNQDWQLPFPENEARQAIYAFNGDVYRGLDAYTISENKLENTQNTVRILSGLYGLLKPFDLIMPYRLEMGTKFPVGKNKNLYDFWKVKITDALNSEMEEDEILLNLASNEYFKAIDVKSLKGNLIQVDFKEFKNGQYKTIGFFAKYARGLMARFIIDNSINDLDGIKAFDLENYAFDTNLSEGNNLVFTR
ncbi:peroxide stress protein YaaA [Paucihalobacter sp.]|uniref:peroxide stress protein YaaA n=1 Tax=Paucihalobacter sp. TaxID=2850405 RepID=UPI002FE00B55